MSMTTIEVRFRLPETIAQKLRETARTRGITEDAVIEQALDLLLGSDEASSLADYQFFVATMREDWDAMPDDWSTENLEVSHALSSR